VGAEVQKRASAEVVFFDYLASDYSLHWEQNDNTVRNWKWLTPKQICPMIELFKQAVYLDVFQEFGLKCQGVD